MFTVLLGADEIEVLMNFHRPWLSDNRIISRRILQCVSQRAGIKKTASRALGTKTSSSKHALVSDHRGYTLRELKRRFAGKIAHARVLIAVLAPHAGRDIRSGYLGLAIFLGKKKKINEPFDDS